MAVEDIEILLSPLDSIRFDVGLILDIMKAGAEGVSGKLNEGIEKFQDRIGVYDSITLNLGKQFSGGFATEKIKEFRGLLLLLTLGIFDEEAIDGFVLHFNEQFKTGIDKSFILAVQGLKLDLKWKTLHDKLKLVSKLFAKGLRPLIIKKFDLISKDIALGMKSQLSKALAFLPDFIKRPLLKLILRSIDGIRNKMSLALKKSLAWQGVLGKAFKFIKLMGTSLIVVASTITVLIMMFKKVEKAWTDINKLFGMFTSTFLLFGRTVLDFSMLTGLTILQFTESAKGVIRLFGFMDKRAIKTGALLSRVFGLSGLLRAKLQRVIGGPGRNIKLTLDDVSKAVILFGGHGKRVFKDIIAMSLMFRALTGLQRKLFIQLSALLSSIGVSGLTVMKNMTNMFSSIDKAILSTKQINLALLLMGFNAGKTFKMFSAAGAIDLYKAMRVGDVLKAFSILTLQMGTDFVKSFNDIKSVAAKQNFLKTAFGDVLRGQKIMDQMGMLLQSFGTTLIKDVKQKFSHLFDMDTLTGKRSLNAFAKLLQQMRMSTDLNIREQAKSIFEGGLRLLILKLQIKVLTDVLNVKTFEDMAEATKTLGMRMSLMWTRFKAGFMKAFLPAINRINDIFGLMRGSSISWAATLGSFLGNLVVFGAKVIFIIPKVLKFFGIIRKVGGIFTKFLGPIGAVLIAFDALATVFTRAENIGQGLLMLIPALIDALLDPFISLFNFLTGSSITTTPLTDLLFGKARGGAYVQSKPGGQPLIVGLGKDDLVVSPVPMLLKIVGKRSQPAPSRDNLKLLTRVQLNSRLLQLMISQMKKPMNIGGKILVDGDFAQIVDSQLSYAN